jgi:hypothetical protein
VYRALAATLAASALLSSGCNMWDAVTSRKFRQEPMKTVRGVIAPEDAVVVLLADPPRPGDERAKAMQRLKEPLRHSGTQDQQDAIIEVLSRAATSDSSPVLRFAAAEALGRFQDPRAGQILMVAYQKADGRPERAAGVQPPAGVVPIGGTSAGRLPTRAGFDPISLAGPVGFAPDVAAALRCRCLESLGRTHNPEAARFLGTVAGADPDARPEGADDPEVRQAAVRGLGTCRTPEAAGALAKVLALEAAKDPALVRGAHDGLVRLTGKRLPPDPQKWNEVVQAGVTIVPEPTALESAIQKAAFWDK